MDEEIQSKRINSDKFLQLYFQIVFKLYHFSCHQLCVNVQKDSKEIHFTVFLTQDLQKWKQCLFIILLLIMNIFDINILFIRLNGSCPIDIYHKIKGKNNHK